MSLESVFRLSLIMNMVDNITGPMGRISSSVNGGVSRLQKLESAFGGHGQDRRGHDGAGLLHRGGRAGSRGGHLRDTPRPG